MVKVETISSPLFFHRKMLALASAMPAFAPSSMPMVQPTTGSISAKMESVEDLKGLAKKLNPVSLEPVF